MKNVGKAFLMLIAGTIALFVCFRPFFSVKQVLVTKDVEFVFLVTDEKTGRPVPQAAIELQSEDLLEVRTENLLTDQEGRARYLRAKTRCEEVIQPWQKVTTHVDRSWCRLTIRAPGYRPLEDASLSQYSYEDQGYFPENQRQRVEFTITLPPD